MCIALKASNQTRPSAAVLRQRALFIVLSIVGFCGHLKHLKAAGANGNNPLGTHFVQNVDGVPTAYLKQSVLTNEPGHLAVPLFAIGGLQAGKKGSLSAALVFAGDNLSAMVFLEFQGMCSQELPLAVYAYCRRLFVPFSGKARYCQRVAEPATGQTCQ